MSLTGEKSPFLLRHANDLVSWMPWGGEPFELARSREQFIFLSIGNSASRWSSAMQRECFTDPEVSELMNSTCVCVLVDADERPDIAGIFMDICQIQNGGASLPLNVLLTPEGQPFFAATWLPKRSTASVPGLADVLPRTKWLWVTARENVYRSANSLFEELNRHSVPVPGGVPGAYLAKTAFKELKNDFDDVWGGFISGGAPKTISAPRLIFLLDYAANKNSKEALEMVEKTVRKMWMGGVHDHIGGGFFESAIDERWIIPRFNKTLSDQSLLLYVAVLLNNLALAEDVAGFMLRELLAPDGAFYNSVESSDDYYLWTEDELRAAIPSSDYALFGQAFSVMRGGNFRHEVTGMATGLNVLYMNEDVQGVASRFYSKPTIVDDKISEIRKTLFEVRKNRAPASVNDQIILAPNGFAIAALAFAGSAFDKKDWIQAAERAMIFCQKAFPDPKGNWRRRYRGKEASVDVQFCDFASLMWAAAELHRATAKSASDAKKNGWLKFASSILIKTEELFSVAQKDKIYGFFATDGKDAHVVRRKLCADGANPGENAVAVRALLLLAEDDEENAKKYRALAKDTAAEFTFPAARTPSAFAFMLGSGLKI